jgi:hypothetical protein
VILNSDPSAQSAWEHLPTPAFSELVQPEPTATYRFAGDCQVPANTCKAKRPWAGITRLQESGIAGGAQSGTGQHLLDSYQYPECRDLTCARPNARYPHPYGCDLWLDTGMNDVATASDLLKTFDARLMRCYPVSNHVNHVGKDDEECSPTCGDRGRSESALRLRGNISSVSDSAKSIVLDRELEEGKSHDSSGSRIRWPQAKS